MIRLMAAVVQILCRGGAGNDTYIIDSTADTIIEVVNAGTDTVLSSVIIYTLDNDLENLTLTGFNDIDGVGNSLNNIITFHGSEDSARLYLRAMALIWNFHPYGSRTKVNHPNRCSPFKDLNCFEYHENWLRNLLIAGSMNGYRL